MLNPHPEMAHSFPVNHCEDIVEKILDGEGDEVTALGPPTEHVHAVALRKTVWYIACAVVFNAKGEVLMVQEAKPDCYKHWYLPAGRMEETESIVEAMKREVKEEAGLECEPVTLLMVEQRSQWIRFTFLAEVTGGSLKTEAEADEESIQAQWWNQETALPLRGNDILRLIAAAQKYKERRWFPPVLPVDVPCPMICERLLLAFRNSDGGLWVLLSQGNDPCLPVAMCTRKHELIWTAHRLVQECLPSFLCQLKIHGILGVQHNGRVPGKTDGICFNMLASIEDDGTGTSASQPPLLEGPRFQWYKVDSPYLREKINQRLTSGSVLPLYSL